MWPYHPDLLARPVPRYTSYPTAAEFTPGVGAAEQAEALDAVADDMPLSLYVHIPFCEAICWYCGCNTGRANKAQRLAAYVDALRSEIRMVSARLRGRGNVRRIAFGGGSPNALSPVEFARLLYDLTVAFGCCDPVISVELDPRSLSDDWHYTLGTCGVSRVSLGVQTFDPAIQAAIGRVQPRVLIVDAVAELRAHGIGSINFDIIYGLPGQDGQSLGDTLDETVALAPERVALFGYAHMPQMLPRQRRIPAAHLPDQAARFAMAALGHDRLVAAGYEPVGFDHFALPRDPLALAARQGTLRRNFQGFTDDASDALIGLGASAISQFPDRLIQNEKNSGRYRNLCAAGRLAGTRGVLRDADDRMRAVLIEELLCAGSADLSELATPPAMAQIRPFLDAGLARLDGHVLSILPDGRPYARTLASLLDRYRAAPSRPQFSSAV